MVKFPWRLRSSAESAYGKREVNSRGASAPMRKEMVLAGVAFVLAGCGEYFDRHPANVRPESEAVAAVFAYRSPASAQTTSGTISAAEPAPTTTRDGGSTAAAAPPAPESAPAAVVVSTSNGKLRPAESVHAGAALEPKNSPVRRPEPTAASEAAVATTHPAPPPSAAASAQTSPPMAAVETTSQTRPAPITAIEVAPSAPPAESAPLIRTTPPAPETVQIEPTPVPATMAMQGVPPPPVLASPVAAPSGSTVDPCKAVARQRAEDAAAGGLDRETQDIVRSGTYANCRAWRVGHPAP